MFMSKCRSEITAQPENSNLSYMIGPTFRNINRLPVLSFKDHDNDPATYLYNKYCMYNQRF